MWPSLNGKFKKLDNTNTLPFGGAVNISKIEIVNFEGVTVSLSGIFSEIQIYEDMFSHSLSGAIAITDVNNMIKNFPIIGEELLNIQYNTRGFPVEAEVTQTFYVYKLVKVEQENPHKMEYVLHFMTTEAFVDLNRPISKAFKGTADTIIQQLLNIDGLRTEKKSELESSINAMKFVSNFWTPFKCINYAASRAMSSDSFHASNFVFFETNKKYKFSSIQKIFTRGNTKRIKYVRDSDTLRDGNKNTKRDVLAETEKILEFKIDEGFDIIKRLMNGAMSQTLYEHNILTKTLKKRTYNYKRQFGATKHLGKHPLLSKKYTLPDNTMTSSVTTYPLVHGIIKEDNYGQIMSTKVPLMEQLEMRKLTMVVNGRTDLEVGDVIEVNITGGEEIDEKDINRPLLDYFSGNYLVTAITHRITPNMHKMVLQIVKDSVEHQFTTWIGEK